jgi:hypothetical protein
MWPRMHRAVDWDSPSWGGNVHLSETGSWVGAESKDEQ